MLRWVATLCLLTLLGCIAEQRYAIENQRVELSADDPPAFLDDNDDPVFVAVRNFELQITPPSAATLDELAQRGAGLPYPRMPWVQLSDLDIQVDYALENRSDEQLTAMIFLDGRNEFNQYEPGPEDLHQWQRRVLLSPRARVTGSISELEMDEVATDLSTVVNGAPNSNLVVQFESQSGLDERTRQYIPRVVAGLVGMRIGLQTGAAVDLRLSVFVRVQDHKGRAAERGHERWTLPAAQPFTPVVPEEG